MAPTHSSSDPVPPWACLACRAEEVRRGVVYLTAPCARHAAAAELVSTHKGTVPGVGDIFVRVYSDGTMTAERREHEFARLEGEVDLRPVHPSAVTA